MAETKKTEAAEKPAVKKAPEDDVNRPVTIRLFKDNFRYVEPLYVGINGKTWLIRRGEDVVVPWYLAEFIRIMEETDQRTSMMIQQQSDQWYEAAAKL